MSQIDLNADMGEGFGRWTIANDDALMDTITSVNVACGMHAGDPDVMHKTMLAARERGIGIGAHPGFADLQGFGRRRIRMPLESLRNLIRYQLGAALAMARGAGAELRHFKLHGALSNIAAEDIDLARTCFETARDFDDALIVLVPPHTAMEAAVRDLGLAVANEIFADRAYEDDGTLRDRSRPGALIHDPEVAAENIATMVREGAILCASGRRLPCRIDTICVHGDTDESLAIARAVRARLEAEGHRLAPLDAAQRTSSKVFR